MDAFDAYVSRCKVKDYRQKYSCEFGMSSGGMPYQCSDYDPNGPPCPSPELNIDLKEKHWHTTGHFCIKFMNIDSGQTIETSQVEEVDPLTGTAITRSGSMYMFSIDNIFPTYSKRHMLKVIPDQFKTEHREETITFLNKTCRMIKRGYRACAVDGKSPSSCKCPCFNLDHVVFCDCPCESTLK
jgi:hypothetical protein